MGSVHGTLPCIVRRQGQIQVAIVALEQRLQVANPGIHILFRVERVVHSKAQRRSGNQLHQAHRALTRPGRRIPVRFRFDHGTH